MVVGIISFMDNPFTSHCNYIPSFDEELLMIYCSYKPQTGYDYYIEQLFRLKGGMKLEETQQWVIPDNKWQKHGRELRANGWYTTNEN